ncbi:MAG TPA: hypothetical protein VFV05_15545 [Methylomirabilota bacterium]|nr:hypothetical protein [Methylomirabilota bacterium]
MKRLALLLLLACDPIDPPLAGGPAQAVIVLDGGHQYCANPGTPCSQAAECCQWPSEQFACAGVCVPCKPLGATCTSNADCCVYFAEKGFCSDTTRTCRLSDKNALGRR